MPKKNSGAGTYGDFKGFFNYSITDGDKSAIRDLEKSIGDKLTFFEDLCGSGYKVTVSRGGASDGWFCSATGKGKSNPNMGRCLTTRHYDVGVALASLHHIIFTVYDDGAWPEEQSDGWDW